MATITKANICQFFQNGATLKQAHYYFGVIRSSKDGLITNERYATRFSLLMGNLQKKHYFHEHESKFITIKGPHSWSGVAV